jgi:hypothetical protein
MELQAPAGHALPWLGSCSSLCRVTFVNVPPSVAPRSTAAYFADTSVLKMDSAGKLQYLLPKGTVLRGVTTEPV